MPLHRQTYSCLGSKGIIFILLIKKIQQLFALHLHFIDKSSSYLHLPPWCSDYHYCPTSFNKAWTQVLRRFKSCTRCVGDSRWWGSPTMVLALKKGKCFSSNNHTTNAIRHHHHRHHHHHHHQRCFYNMKQIIIIIIIIIDDVFIIGNKSQNQLQFTSNF